MKQNLCKRCGHKWLPRGESLACPKCKRYDWKKVSVVVSENKEVKK